MKILYLHQYFNTPKMSGSTRSYEVARRLASLGHSVIMLTSDRDGLFANETGWTITNEAEIEVHWLNVPYSNKMSYFKRSVAFLKFMFFSIHYSKNFKPDVVLASSTPLTIAIPGVRISKRNNVPLVFEVRDLWPEIPIALKVIQNPALIYLSRKLADWAYKNAESVIALSPQMKEGIFKRNADKFIKTIPNGSDVEVFFPDQIKSKVFRQDYKIPNDSILITYAGAFGLVNGVSYIVKLAEKFKENKRVFFLLLGNGSECEKVLNLADELGCLNHNLLWIDSLPKEKMPYVLSATDISLSTVIPVRALEANSANKVFDGMASGCCIAINHKGWLKDLIEKNEAGLCLSQDLNKSYAKLNAYIQNPLKLTLAKEKSRKLAIKEFNYNKLANDVLMVLERSIKDK